MSLLTPEEEEKIAKGIAKVGIGGLRRHLFLCAGPKCCSAEVGEEAWGFLKTRIAELGLNVGVAATARSRCHCLHICSGGPIGVVYPEGIWYRDLTKENLERVLQEHIRDGSVVEELVIARGPLPGDDDAEPWL